MEKTGFTRLGGREERAELDAMRVKLERDFAPAVPVALIDLVFKEEQDRLAGAPRQPCLPLVAERAARDRLRGLTGAPRR